jgi:hypothetical protein
MRVVNQQKWNRSKIILCCITGFITLSFTGGLDHAEGKVYLEQAIIFGTITIALAINIYKTSSTTTKGETR